MEVLKTFGINWYLVIAQIVNFLIIFYLLKRFVYKPVFAMLKKREALARETIEDNQKSKQTLEFAEKERAALIKKARDDARDIVENAKSESYQILEHAQASAKKQTERMIKEAHETMERDVRAAEQKLQKKIGILIERVIKISLQDLLTPDEQKEIIKKTLKHLPVTK